jgi:cobalt-zinc-cadmium efflux system membrane fusion protein
MASEPLRVFLQRVRRAVRPEAGGVSDAHLLERFVTRQDEAAFEVLLWRHGGLVLHVCGRLLRHAEDAEDVFQAAFLALARRGRSIGKGEAVGSWLYKVAYRLALRVRARTARDAAPMNGCAVPAPQPSGEVLGPDERLVLDDEIYRLPEKYRAAVVLCYLEGKTTQEAARQLGCARGTVCSRLAWARRRLRSRLTRRGLTLAAAALAALRPEVALASAGTKLPALVGATLRAAVLFVAKPAAGSALLGPSAALAEGVLRAMALTKLKTAAAVLVVLGVLGLGAGLCTQRLLAQKPGVEEEPVLVRGNDGVRLPADTATKLGVRTVEVKAREARPRVLRLPGSLAIDPTHLQRIRVRFAPAEVVEIGQVVERTKAGRAQSRELRPGDRVKKGDVLAVFFSADVGARKSALFDALLQLKLDEEILKRTEENKGAVPEAFILNARRTVSADQSAVARAVNTLRILGIPTREIDAIRQEAKEAGDRKGKPETGEARKAREDRWALVELRAPADGTIVERNLALHEVITDGPATVFQIANLDRLLVLANAAEDDLPALNALAPEKRVWTVRTAGPGDGVKGPIEEISYLIDPNQHTAVVKGHIDNPDGHWRAGQFVTASITLPPAPGEVSLPAAAVVDTGTKTFVLIQPDPMKLVFEQRRVLVVRRGEDRVHIRSRLTPEQERQGYQTVRLGDRVVTSGAVEIKALLDDLEAARDR